MSWFYDVAEKLVENSDPNGVDASAIKFGEELAGLVNLDATIVIPASQPEKLETWKVQASATVPQLQIADQRIDDVSLVANLQEGNLILDPVRATIVPEVGAAAEGGVPNSNAIELSVNWPVGLVEGDAKDGTIKLSLKETSMSWFYDVAEKLVENSDPDGVDASALKFGEELAGSVNLDATILIPASQPEKLETWKVQANASVPQLQVADQRIDNVSLVANLQEGNLILDPVRATIVPEVGAAAEGGVPNSNAIELSVNWPVTLVEGDGQNGKINLAVKKTSIPLIYRVAQTFVGNSDPANVDPAVKFGEELAGFVNLDATISLPASQPEKLDDWVATANIRDSEIGFDDQTLSNATAEIQLEKSNLVVTGFSATNGLGDPLKGDFAINLDDPERFSANLKADSLSVRWLEAVYETYASTVVTDAAEPATASGEVDYRRIMKSVEGNFGIDLAVKNSAGDLPDAADGLNVELTVASQKIAFAGVEASQLGVRITTDADQLKIEDLKLKLGRNSELAGKGQLDLNGENWSGNFAWVGIPLQDLERLASQFGSATGAGNDGDAETVSVLKEGYTSGKVTIESATEDVGGIAISNGNFAFEGLEAGNFKLKPFGFDANTVDGTLKLTNFTSDDDQLAIDGGIGVALTAPYQFNVDGRLAGLSLARFFERKSVLEPEGETTELTGTVSGPFAFSGTLSPFDWQSNGRVKVRDATVNSQPIDDILVDWEHSGDDWEKSKIVAQIFGGKVRLAELTTNPERVRIEIDEIDVKEATALLELPVELTGKLSGEASLDEWSLEETSRADISLNGSSLLIGVKKFGDFNAKAEYKNGKLDYDMGGTLLSGKLTAKGSADVDVNRLSATVFPVELNLTNGTLTALYGSSNAFRSLRPLEGGISAEAKFLFPLDAAPTGEGRLLANNVKWNSQILTQQSSLRFKVDEKQLVFDDVKLGLKRGEVSANVVLPLGSQSAGRFDVEFRQLDLERLSKVVGAESIEAYGQIDAKLQGRIGRDITGQGYVGVDQASLHGVAGQSARVPVAFEFSPSRQSGRVYLKRSKFRLFEGSVAGKATVEFGRRLSVDTDLKFSKVNSGELIESLFDYGGLDQGLLNGRLILSGRDIRSGRDLKGTFTGQLSRAAAFDLPILSQIDQVVTTRRLDTGTYDSDEIKLTLNRGKISLKQLNFSSSFAKVAIDGNAFIDGRLDLNVAAQVETLNQPTLVDELLGSPLAQLSGTPTAFFARAAEFLSERVVFLHVGGTANRPQIRVDTRQQVREELTRYFLRDSNLVPSASP